MTNPIHTNAARIRNLFIEVGEAVGPLSCSTNRNGDHSAYFFWRGVDVRISDHMSRTAATGLVFSVCPQATSEDVAKLIQQANRTRCMASVASFAKAVISAIKADCAEAARSAEARSAAARKAAWEAHLATLGLEGASQTKINAAQKEWRKANPIEAFQA